ncbi:MAG: hypothetical protein HDR09_07365 [Lachnospiraceae bacterium]|nr:hypothetical protein [Lachnospiraceae bacterium]
MDIMEILQTREARINFLKGLIRLAKADGIVDEKEFAFYQQAAISLQLGEEEILTLDKIKSEEHKIALDFETDREKMFFLIQAVQLCWMDNNYSEAEQKELRTICQEIAISEEALKAVEAWAQEGVEWNKRGETLLALH